ncbi:MAG: hypothetical protein Q8Q09_01645, partial [Deltaproteobacteria bacterium]|nr:hypothetical protein [Deltaproteobacteria bacterium]
MASRKKTSPKAAEPKSKSKSRRNAHWDWFPPGTPYPSAVNGASCTLKHVGAVVPGRRGGLATGCATPSKKHPREAQYFVAGAPMRRSVVSRRLSGKKTTFKGFDWAYWEESYAAVKEPFHVPSPLGVEFPHRPGTSPCDAEHPIWEGWAEALEDARERAAIVTENSDPEDSSSYLRAVLGEMRKHPRFE